MDNLDSNLAKEVLSILLYVDKDIQDKIPKDIITILTNLSADSDIVINFEANKKLHEQNISEEALNVFSALYYEYVADEEEKKMLVSSWKENENN